jgi:hypothetical protein
VKLAKDPTKRLDEAGTLLYGESYRRKLARVCGVSFSLVYKWPPTEPGLLDEYLLAAVQSELVEVRKRHAVLIELHDALMKMPARA